MRGDESDNGRRDKTKGEKEMRDKMKQDENETIRDKIKTNKIK